MWKQLAFSAVLTLATLAPVGADGPDYRQPRRDLPRERRGDRRDDRTYWRLNDGAFEWLGGRKWRQVRDRGAPIPLRETDRTRKYVELYDESRQIYLRLYDDQAYQRGPDDEEWGAGAKGRWE